MNSLFQINQLKTACRDLFTTWYQVNQIRFKWPRKKYYSWVEPKYFKRYPPPPGVEPKKYPLEPAAEEILKNNNSHKLNRWTDWRMKKDYLRRQCVIKLGRERMMLDLVYQNNILPYEIKDAAMREVQEDFPRDSNPQRLTRRCAVTSRPRATVEPWRVSRFIFRHLADYNKLSGVQRGIW